MSSRSLEHRTPPSQPPRKTPERPPSAGAAAPSPTSAPDDVWLEELLEKDELILALTEQLEQAAEQLDRLQRMGADRRRGPQPASGVPQELVEEQKQTLEDLQRAVQQWEDMQAGLTLGRIEIQISELRDLIVQNQQAAAAIPLLQPGSPLRHGSPPTHDADSEVYEEEADLPSSVDARPQASHPQETSEWERLKSQLLAESETPADSPSTTSTVIMPAPGARPSPPAKVDIASANREVLLKAISERDQFIEQLLGRLRQMEMDQAANHIIQEELGSAEYMQRVKWLEQRLEDHLRNAEVELSVERAKIARERAQIVQQHEQIERQLKKLGIRSIDEIEQAASSPGNTQERRWARFLGR